MSSAPAQEAPAAAFHVVTQGLWFGDEARPAFGWLSRPRQDLFRPSSGVVIAPPFGYPYWGSHRTLRVLAESLARHGHAVLRIDYDGTGDSAGDQWDPDRVAAWRGTLRHAVAELRRTGARETTVVGVRIGATLAILDGAALGADAIVAWLPIQAGRRYAKELRLLAEPIPEADDPLEPPGTLTFAGSVFSAQTLQDLRSLKITEIGSAPAPAALVIDDPQGSCADTVAHLRSLGMSVEHRQLEGSERALELAPEYATVPEEIVAAIVDWMGAASELNETGETPPPPPWTRATLEWRTGEVTEEVVTLAPGGHVAIVTSPTSSDPDGATLVLLNPGSETHVGPGRAWVEVARDLALAGRRTARVDFVGWGESPDDGHAPGRPYDPHCVPDTLAIVRELRAVGHERVICCGLCASAWIALDAAREGEMNGLIALNPQLYWQQGDTVEIDWTVIRAGRATEIRRIERGARIGAWSLLDALGQRPRVARWLDAVAITQTPTQLLFTADDDGLRYLETRLARYLKRLRDRGVIGVAHVPELDHPLHRAWLRQRLVGAILDALRAIESPTH